MNKVRDEVYVFTVLGRPAWCRLAVYQAADGAIVVVASAAADNPGPSITAWAAPLAQAVWQASGQPPAFTWIEHYPTSADPAAGESFALVVFARDADQVFARPRWQAVSGAAIAALLAQPALGSGVGEWASLPVERVTLDCRQCGRPLAVPDVLAGRRQCAACAAEIPAPMDDAASADELAAVRARWVDRTSAQVARLRLTNRQYAALLAALLAARSVWNLTGAELERFVAQLAAFPDAAAVEAFLAMRGPADDPPPERARASE